jgi:hypothetical protein
MMKSTGINEYKTGTSKSSYLFDFIEFIVLNHTKSSQQISRVYQLGVWGSEVRILSSRPVFQAHIAPDERATEPGQPSNIPRMPRGYPFQSSSKLGPMNGFCRRSPYAAAGDLQDPRTFLAALWRAAHLTRNDAFIFCDFWREAADFRSSRTASAAASVTFQMAPPAAMAEIWEPRPAP